MRLTDHTLPRRMPMLLAILAAMLLVLAACQSESGATAESSATAEASTAESTAPSAEASAEESAEASEDDGGELAVSLAGFAFEPSELTVSVGDTVRFTNEDSAPHTVTEGTNGNADDDAAFDEEVAAGEWVEITFEEAGDINVTCLFHGNMNMVVHVE